MTPQPLPGVLMDEPPITKLMWLYLLPKGPVSYSTRKLAAALYLSPRVATATLGRLRALELLTDLSVQRARVNSAYQAVEPGGRAGSVPAGMDARNPPPLPTILAEATPTTRLVYVYLKPYSGADVSVRGLEALLNISHRPAFEALRDLRKLGLASLARNARDRPRGTLRR